MRRLIATIALIAVAAVVGYGAGLKAKENEYRNLDEKLAEVREALDTAKERSAELAEENATLKEKAVDGLIKVVETSQSFSKQARSELADKLIELGQELKANSR